MRIHLPCIRQHQLILRHLKRIFHSIRRFQLATRLSSCRRKLSRDMRIILVLRGPVDDTKRSHFHQKTKIIRKLLIFDAKFYVQRERKNKKHKKIEFECKTWNQTNQRKIRINHRKEKNSTKRQEREIVLRLYLKSITGQFMFFGFSWFLIAKWEFEMVLVESWMGQNNEHKILTL